MGKVPKGYITLTFRVHNEDGQYVARCEELGISTCAKSIDKAFHRIEEATTLYLNTLEEVGERDRAFQEAGIEVMEGEPPTSVDVPVRSDEVVSRRNTRVPEYAFC